MNPLPINNDHNNHYENADYVAGNINVPEIIPNVAQIINLQQQQMQQQPQQLQQQQQPHPVNYRQQHPANYRNEIYERNGGYDVPRNIRNNYPFQGAQRRSNLHLDFNRPRCPMTHQQRAKYQRSFDDTESCYYGNSSQYTYKKYENMYERVREEPLYQNATAGVQQQNMYGRLDVIGHGIGRIERHLSSSCGNIDHYNVGSHYAVVNGHHPHPNGHMHVNNVNPVNPGAPGTQGTSKDTVKSFFSCLGGENSQSMNNINGTTPAQNPFVNPTLGPSVGPSVVRNTGAIPKSKAKANKVCPKPNNIPIAPPLPPAPAAVPPPSTISSAQNTLNRISKTSLQYLMVNKYLPFGPDYKIIDFNFMFSRNCQNGAESGGSLDTGDQELVRFNGQAEMVRPDDVSGEFGEFFPPPREYPTMNGNYPRIIRNTPQLGRLRECDGEIQYENLRGNPRINNFRARSESPSFSGSRMRNHHQQQQQQQQQMKQNVENSGQDQFRNWSFNFENNSFRPAGASGIRRITDGTLSVRDFQEQNPSKELPAVIVENQSQELQEPQASSSSKSSSPSISENSSNPSGTYPTSSQTSGSSSNKSTTGELKKSENYDNLASLQQPDPPPAPAPSVNKRKKKSTESQSSDSITLMDDEDENNDDFDDLESDID